MKTPEDTTAPTEARLEMIPHGHMAPWGEQPRKHFDASELAELRLSIQARGMLANFPLTVRRRVKMQIIKRVGAEPNMPEEWCVEQMTTAGHWMEVDVLASEDAAQIRLMQLSRFDIIDGERRWRVAGEENISLLPCVISDLSDAEALELALVSALQKVGLNPMEIADGYRRLLDLRGPDDQPLNTEATIAAKVGKGERSIKDALGLCSLRGTSAAEAIASGEMAVTIGRLIGRLPTRELREEWTKKVLKNPWGPSPMPRAQLEQRLQEDVMKELRGSGFDSNDPDLVPMVQEEGTGARKLGGACTDCHFNTRNMEADAEAPKSRTHMCMHPVCFRMKEEATHERWRKEHDNPTKQVSTLPKVWNDKLWAPSGTVLAFNTDFVELDEKPPETDLKPGAAKNVGTWKELIKGQEVPVIVARDEKGKAHRLVKHDAALAAAAENKHRIFKADVALEEERTPAPDTKVDAVAESVHRETEAKVDRDKIAAEEAEKERTWVAQVAPLADAITAAKHPPEGFFDLLFTFLERYFPDGRNLAAQRRGVDAEHLEKTMVKGNDASFAAGLIEVIAHDEWWSTGREAGLALIRSVAKIYGVDLKAAEKAELAKIKQEAAAAAEAKDIDEGLVWKGRRIDQITPQPFNFGDNQLCENPERCELTFPKSLKISASVSLAFSDAKGGWVVGWFVQAPKYGSSRPVSANETHYDTRALALRTGLLAIAAEMKSGGAPELALQRLATWIASIGEVPPPPAKKTKAPAKKKAKAKPAKKKGAKK